MLAELRESVREALASAEGMPVGFTALDYKPETLTPPCAVVVPANPYFRTFYDRPDPRLPFAGRLIVGVDVLLLTSREAAKTEADLADQMLEGAYRALSDYDISRASRPGVVTVSGSKYIGSVLSIEEVTEEP